MVYAGVTEVDDNICPVSFMDYDPGFIDNTLDGVDPASENPFRYK
jgi:hypothetical protein